jgi:hypothetical protein
MMRPKWYPGGRQAARARQRTSNARGGQHESVASGGARTTCCAGQTAACGRGSIERARLPPTPGLESLRTSPEQVSDAGAL